MIRAVDRCVDVVDVEGGRLTLYHDPSYEAAIIEAEEAPRDWGVKVDDLVALMAGRPVRCLPTGFAGQPPIVRTYRFS